MVQVRVLNVTRVSVSPAGATTPERLRLSFLDTVWISLPPVQRLFLFSTDRPLHAVAEVLRASLSRTISRFYSLAGKFTHAPDSGGIVISFSGGGHDGIDVWEAEADGVEFQRLVEDEDHDVEAFSLLVPPLDVSKLPAPVFSVQVTGFAAGGVAVGLSMHHMAADGKGLWQFVEAWATECRGGATGDRGGELAPVLLDRSVVSHPREEEIAGYFLRTLAPDLPQSCNAFPLSPIRREELSRRTFVVGAASIASLRDRGASGGSRPSAFVALSAHTWLTFLGAKDAPLDGQNAFLTFLADCRRRLDPPVGDGYFGNCVRPCYAQATSRQLLGGGAGGFQAMCAAIRQAIDESLREPLSDCESWLETYMGMPPERMVNVVASPRFRAYDADFGWGRPARVELVSMNRDGEVALVAARDEEGGVQATVALSQLYMDRFGSLFLDGLQQQQTWKT